MSRGLHRIVGSETDQARPIAYMRRGRTRRYARRRPLGVAVLAGAAILLSLAALCAFGPSALAIADLATRL
jgi:hypothetical protein